MSVLHELTECNNSTPVDLFISLKKQEISATVNYKYYYFK